MLYNYFQLDLTKYLNAILILQPILLLEYKQISHLIKPMKDQVLLLIS